MQKQPLSLSDQQLWIVMAGASSLAPELRGLFLEALCRPVEAKRKIFGPMLPNPPARRLSDSCTRRLPRFSPKLALRAD